MPIDIDPELVERARREGGAALERLVSLVWPHAYRIAAAILRDRSLAEDAAQEACAAIVRALPALRDVAAFHTWTRRVAARHAIDVGRRHRGAASLEDSAGVPIHTDDHDAVDLYRALAALPLLQRAAVVLHYYGGHNSLEIARATGVTAPTVRFHLMLARRTLRAALSEQREITHHAS